MAYDEKLAERMRARLEAVRGITEKKMFGGIGFLVNGNMACGVIKQELIARLSEQDFAACIKKPHVRIFDMTGKPMKGWVMVAPKGVASGRALQGWLDKSIAFAGSLPRK
jgi:TfoX/Sxy family transcriptional regulator of competence genes